MKEKKLTIKYECREPNEALEKEINRAINHLCQGWEWIGSGYDFKTKVRDIEYRALKDF